jgi:hypothetical protein
VRKLKDEVVRLKRETDATSPQDDFARWARLRRQHDKAKEQYEAKGQSTAFSEARSGSRSPRANEHLCSHTALRVTHSECGLDDAQPGPDISPTHPPTKHSLTRLSLTAKDLQSFRNTFNHTFSTLRWLSTQGLQFFCNFYFSKEAMFYLPQGWVPYPVEWILSFPKAPLGGISVNVWAIACASVIALVSEGVRAGLTLREGKVIAGTNRGARVQTGTSSGGNGSAGANGGGNGGSATATGREL